MRSVAFTSALHADQDDIALSSSCRHQRDERENMDSQLSFSKGVCILGANILWAFRGNDLVYREKLFRIFKITLPRLTHILDCPRSIKKKSIIYFWKKNFCELINTDTISYFWLKPYNGGVVPNFSSWKEGAFFFALMVRYNLGLCIKDMWDFFKAVNGFHDCHIKDNRWAEKSSSPSVLSHCTAKWEHLDKHKLPS